MRPANDARITAALRNMQPSVIVAAKCHWCSRQLSPRDVWRFCSGQRMCQRCHEWHGHALQILSGAIPRGCQACGISLDTLNAITPGTTTRMYVVPKDGVYQVLCLACKDQYCAKRADLYRDTQFGHEVLKLA